MMSVATAVECGISGDRLSGPTLVECGGSGDMMSGATMGSVVALVI